MALYVLIVILYDSSRSNLLSPQKGYHAVELYYGYQFSIKLATYAMKTTAHISSLCVEQQPLDIIVYHKILRLALAFGASDEHAEEMAISVSLHAHNKQTAKLTCAIENEEERHSLIIHAYDHTWQEDCTLPSCPDNTTIKEQQILLADLSLPSFLQQMQERHVELQQQRNSLRQENERLTVKINHTNMAMEHQAMHDQLTGLPNRPLLIERANHALQIAKRQHFSCCLMLMDLNNFKDINDTLSHQVGDLMLQEVANRFKRCLRNSDTLARLGGDEFAVLLLNNNADQANIVANKLHHVLLHPFELAGNTLSIDISIGIAEFPDHGDDLLSLLRRADVAMYHAKHKKLRYSLYNPLLDEHSIERLTLLNDLNHAIKKGGGLELYYQPQVLTEGDGMPSLEALIRWVHPKKGLVFPDRFIPMAEDSGLITPLTWWVMETAVAQCAAWHKAGLPVTVSINFSAHCLQEPDVAERVEACIKRHHLPDHALVIEITESMIMEDPHQASKVLLKIDAMKVDVSIDDFGTGHSSLAYLKHLLVDELKIDRSFVMGMHEHHNDEIIVRTVINMAHSMGLRVVGEGVEDRKSWDALAAMSCERIQGYFISRPLPVEQITLWLEAFSKKGLTLDNT